MRSALQNAAQRVKAQGTLVVAIYNRHVTSPIWSVIKRFYNALPPIVQKLLIWAFAPVIFLAKLAVTRQHPLKMARGMDFTHNIIDWLGGYPYEYASLEEMKGLLEALGMQVIHVVPARMPTGCNEYVCRNRI